MDESQQRDHCITIIIQKLKKQVELQYGSSSQMVVTAGWYKLGGLENLPVCWKCTMTSSEHEHRNTKN